MTFGNLGETTDYCTWTSLQWY